MTLYVPWCVWRERNDRVFDDTKSSVIKLKWLCVKTLFDWAHAHMPTTSDTLLDFFVIF